MKGMALCRAPAAARPFRACVRAAVQADLCGSAEFSPAPRWLPRRRVRDRPVASTSRQEESVNSLFRSLRKVSSLRSSRKARRSDQTPFDATAARSLSRLEPLERRTLLASIAVGDVTVESSSHTVQVVY